MVLIGDYEDQGFSTASCYYHCWLLLLLLVLISTISSSFIDAENLMVGKFEAMERCIGRVILIRGCEDQGCLHLSPIW